MDPKLKEEFINLWREYFDGAALPIVFSYTDEQGSGEMVNPPKGHRCVIADLSKVRSGKSLLFGTDSIGCAGGRRYLGFSHETMPDFEYFLSLSGLFTLSNFDEVDPNGVFAPFAAGCGAIVQYPYLEKASECPRGVLGMFDVSARPWVPDDVLTFSVPMHKFVRVVENMAESFLITASWAKVRKRIPAKAGH